MGRKRPTGTAAPPPYHHGDLHRALLDASLDVLEEAGERALTLREVARRAGVSHAAPYRHFADRDALLAAVNDAAFGALLQALTAAVGDVAAHDGRARLLRAIQRYVEFAIEHPAQYRLMFGGPRVEQPAGAGAPLATFEFVEALVSECQRQRIVRAGSPERYTNMVWAIAHGVASLALNDRFGEAAGARFAARLARDAVDTFLAGLAPDA